MGQGAIPARPLASGEAVSPYNWNVNSFFSGPCESVVAIPERENQESQLKSHRTLVPRDQAECNSISPGSLRKDVRRLGPLKI